MSERDPGQSLASRLRDGGASNERRNQVPHPAPPQISPSQLDTRDTLAGAEIALSVAWDVMPVSGGLRRIKGPASDMVSGGFVPRKPCFSLARCNKLLPAGKTADPRALLASLSSDGTGAGGSQRQDKGAGAAAASSDEL